MTNKTNQNLFKRLWRYQSERAPLFAMIVMASLTVGVIARFAHTTSWQYLASVAIVVLYLLQIRMSDEKKDFEHDNQFYPDRPVQRGVVSLGELVRINQVSIGLQILLYASFLNWQIFLLGLASQGYAYLTRKEFFVREWIRQHFFIYHFSHWFQIVILSSALIGTLKPSASYWQLITLIMLNVISIEVGRKMRAKEDDTTDDTFSAQLGHKGSATTLSLLAVMITAISYYFIQQHGQNFLFMIAPVLATGAVLNSAYHYAIDPNKANAKYVEYTAGFLLLGSTLSVILGA